MNRTRNVLHNTRVAPLSVTPCSFYQILSSKISGFLPEKLRRTAQEPSFEKSHRHSTNMEDNMDVKSIFQTQEKTSCPWDLSESGSGLVHFNSAVSVADGGAGNHCSGEEPSRPADVIACHTDNCCLKVEGSAPGQSLTEAQACKRTGLGGPLTSSAPTGNGDCSARGGAEDSASVVDVFAETISSVSDDFSDDDLEYFECSDVLTVHENEIWREKMQFLLEDDDADDLKLSKDCDGCAYFLCGTPRVSQVSDNTTPMDTPIGFSGHHSKLKGVNESRDPSVCSQSALQTEMTLTVGHHRDSLKDKEKYKVPVASAAAGNDHPTAEEDDDGSGQSAFSTDTSESPNNGCAGVGSSCRAIGAALASQAPETMSEHCSDKDVQEESSLLLEEGAEAVPEERARHAVCTVTESLRRNLLKLLNPKELCRYVSAIGQSFQTAAAVSQSSAPFASQEGVVSAQSPEEPESLRMQAAFCHPEEADKDCHWERRRTGGLSEQDQMPHESASCRNQLANLKIFPQNCETLCVEPEREKEGIFMRCMGTICPASEVLCADKMLLAEDVSLETRSQHHEPCEKRDSCPQQVFYGQGVSIAGNGNTSESDTAPFPLQDRDSVPDKQERLCAVLSSAKLCDELREGEQRFSFDSHDGKDTHTLCRPSCDEAPFEANPKSVLASGEPGCRGDADISAVHDKLWKLLNEDDSHYQIPFENQGITSLGTRPADLQVPELSFVQDPCSDHPFPAKVTEQQEAVPQPASRHGTERADRDVSGIPLRTDEASTGNVCLAQVEAADGARLDSSAASKMETAPVCLSADSIDLSTGEGVRQEPNQTVPGSDGPFPMTVAWEGKLPISHSSQTRDADPPQRLENTQRGDVVCGTETPACVSEKPCGTAAQLLHAKHSVSVINDSVPAKGCHCGGCAPAGEDLARFPEEKGIFPRESTNQFTHEELSSVNIVQNSSEENSPGRGRHSDLNAQNCTNCDSSCPSESDGCQDPQGVCSVQQHGCVTQLPDVLTTPEPTAPKNLPQSVDHLMEVETQEVAVGLSCGDPRAGDFSAGAPRCEPCKTGEREISMGGEKRAETCCGSGESQVSESQTAVSPLNASQQQVSFVGSAFRSDEEFNRHSSESHTHVMPVRALLPRRDLSEHHGTADEGSRGSSNQLDTQQLIVKEPLPIFMPISQSEALLTSASAAGGAGTEETASAQMAVKADENVGLLGTCCRAAEEQFHLVPAQSKEEGVFCENHQEVQRSVEHNPDEAETKCPSRTLVSPGARGHLISVSTKQSCPDLISSSKFTGAGNSVKAAGYEGAEEVLASESVGSALVNLPPLDSGNNRCFQEQPPCSRAQPFSLALSRCEPFPGNAEGLRNQEGSKSYQTSLTVAEPEPIQHRQDTAKGGPLAAGAKKKLPAAALSKKPRLEERGNVSEDPNSVKSRAGTTCKEDGKEQRKPILKKDSRAPKLLKKIQAELFPDCSGNIKLCCQFGEIHGDSTITWTKDSKLLARLQRSVRDDSPVSLAIAKASPKDQGMYYCCLSNVYGKVTAEFHLTAEVLEHLSNFQNREGVEEIEFMQLMFREDFISGSYFGGNLHGVIATEELHFGEGMHRKAFRSKVMQGLVPVFSPGHPCVLKVHNAITYGTKSKDDLVEKNYKLALQECYVQNTAREYAKVYAAEAEPLEGFGEVPEIIPIFLVHRPANNIPYATVEEELVGEFVKYSVKDGKEVNFLRRDSEAGQKCCTFQHWVYEKTSGSLLVTDLQGVGMKLTDVGIATQAKGYKGFKGNCSVSFIEQFRALHQCNKYCEMLGLKPLRTTHQKQRKATASKSKSLASSSAMKKAVPKKAREPRDFISAEH